MVEPIMMFISEARIDNKGRITLPKKFLEANNILKDTRVRFQTIQGQNYTIKMIFDCNETSPRKDNETSL